VFNTHASGGNLGYLGSFATSWAASRLVGVEGALSHLPSASGASDFLGDVAGTVAGLVTAPPPPCQEGH